jgi:large subunit ribosomal protein L30
MAETQTPKKVRITWVKSTIGYTVRHKATIRALGLKKMHQTVEHDDSPTLRGMMYLVKNLIRIEESE